MGQGLVKLSKYFILFPESNIACFAPSSYMCFKKKENPTKQLEYLIDFIKRLIIGTAFHLANRNTILRRCEEWSIFKGIKVLGQGS